MVRKIAAALALTLGSCVVVAPIANAAVVQVEGGTWNYGTNKTKVWSHYQHQRRTHSASVGNGDGNWQKSGWKRPGRLAKAETYRTTRNNQSFYDVK